MFSFFKKKPADAPAAPPPVVPDDEASPKRTWFERLRGAPDEPPPSEPPRAQSREQANEPARSNVDVPTPSIEPLGEAAESPEPADVETPSPDARRSWVERLRGGLRKTGSSIAQVFTGTQIDDALYEELEGALLMADAGVKATEFLLADLKRRVKEAKASDPLAVKSLLADAVAELLAPLERPLQVGKYSPTVMMVVGVNGAGKTTTIGKLTRHLDHHHHGR